LTIPASVSAASPPQPWAFWAPSQDGSIASALQLARVQPGTRFLDLGCGDGRVLVAAGRVGAEVRGVEIDPLLAGKARKNLEEAAVAGTVEVGDMFTASLDADVIYAYLTPVTLSLLRARLEDARPGTRVVTPRYGVAGWEPTAFEANCYLYELPARRESTGVLPGWCWRAIVLVLPANRRTLVPLTLTGCGPITLDFDPPLARATTHAVGDSSLDGPPPVPVDLIFQPHGAGSVIAGSIRALAAEVTVAAVFAHDGFGQWNFDSDQGQQFRKTLDGAIAAARRER
jgi:hypothetical protein